MKVYDIVSLVTQRGPVVRVVSFSSMYYPHRVCRMATANHKVKGVNFVFNEQKAKRSEDTLFHITSECWKSTRLGCPRQQGGWGFLTRHPVLNDVASFI
ncbi:hypothetical protein F2Q69_00051255 [Brassica cretica]|uniref:Uncharacterized protein n=1 Tax=Brassica cretica TaxID=69181 RepID=A0A8S9PSE0_BRACR|nr:hypothetical protein F2Q69_00051255 [Brassica cretica]